ncbi:phage portal protein [Nocardia sp. NPDC057227]|uniref:phage portal protein n=1 Tax=Nocardia sp. NPDC057227 TaxID=3346056 RepID=UPI003643EE16
MTATLGSVAPFAAAAQPEPVGEQPPQGLADAKLLEYVRDVMWPAFEAERERLRVIDLWMKGDQADSRVPNGATKELKNLLALSKTPWLGLVVTTIAQTLYVDGYKSPEAKGNIPGPWATWNANGMEVRQLAIHRGAVGYGYSYETVLPGIAPGNVQRAVMRGVSPKRMLAVYEDPGADEWPELAMKVEPQRGGAILVKVLDHQFVHRMLRTSDDKWTYLGLQEHGAGVCPVVRFTNMLDLEGNTPGEVEPFIPVASRIDKTEYDRLSVQHHNSWKVWTASGMANFAESEEEANLKKLKLRMGDILIAEDPDTKFGTLDETGLKGFIDAADADRESLAAVAQLPSHLLTGKLVNLSAEALAAARASLTQKAYERKVSLGAAHSQALRLAAKLDGDIEAAQDVYARVTWQDVEVRSLAQAVDALGKAAQMLGIPRQFLWSRIPGVTADDVKEWVDHALDDDPLTQYLRDFDKKNPAAGQSFGPDPTEGGALYEAPEL